MIPLGASLWGQSCGDVFFTVLEPEPVDCYTVKVPVMLSSSINVDICGMSIRGSVSSSYAAARQVDIAGGQSLSAGEQLLELAFFLLDSSFSPADIWLDQSLMAAEAYLGSDSSIAARHFVLETPGGGMRPAPGSTATPAGRARVYPNPSDRNFVLQVDSAKDQAGRLVVLNAAGQAIHEQAIDLPQGQASFLIEGSERWPTGIYYLQLYADGLPVFSEKLLRQ